MGFEGFETKESRLCFLLVFRVKTLQKPLRDDCFKNENNRLPRFFFGAIVGVFLQRLISEDRYKGRYLNKKA